VAVLSATIEICRPQSCCVSSSSVIIVLTSAVFGSAMGDEIRTSSKRKMDASQFGLYKGPVASRHSYSTSDWIHLAFAGLGSRAARGRGRWPPQ
jgi:hypothetical protein